jgi:hypothetical protein
MRELALRSTRNLANRVANRVRDELANTTTRNRTRRTKRAGDNYEQLSKRRRKLAGEKPDLRDGVFADEIYPCDGQTGLVENIQGTAKSKQDDRMELNQGNKASDYKEELRGRKK